MPSITAYTPSRVSHQPSPDTPTNQKNLPTIWSISPFIAGVLHELDAPVGSLSNTCKRYPQMDLAFSILSEHLSAADLNWLDEEGFGMLVDMTEGADEHVCEALIQSLTQALKHRSPWETTQQIFEKSLSEKNRRGIERSLDRSAPVNHNSATWGEQVKALISPLINGLQTFRYLGSDHEKTYGLDHEALARHQQQQQQHSQKKNDSSEGFGMMQMLLSYLHSYGQISAPDIKTLLGEDIRQACQVERALPDGWSLLPGAEALPMPAPVNTAALWNSFANQPASQIGEPDSPINIPQITLTDEVETSETAAFAPGDARVNEHRQRAQADFLLHELITRLREKGFYDTRSEKLFLSLLTQLPEWPAGTQLKVFDSGGQLDAVYLKGSVPTQITNSVDITRLSNGEYASRWDSSAGANNQEELLEIILGQLPKNSSLGKGGDFQFISEAGRIITLREQMAVLAKAEQAQLFDALIADESLVKGDPDVGNSNPFLPFWQQTPPSQSSPVLTKLHELNPELSTERLRELLKDSPLNEPEQATLVFNGTLPAAFIEAVEQIKLEVRQDAALDAIYHPRNFNPDADLIVRDFVRTLLMDKASRELLIIEPGDTDYNSDDISSSQLVLEHDGNGNYFGLDQNGAVPVNKGSDSFYRAVGILLQPHERQALGMQSDTDATGLRRVIGDAVAQEIGGWFSPPEIPQDLQPVNRHEDGPEWLENASTEDVNARHQALENYQQALIAAQVPELPDITEFGQPEKLRAYAKEQLGQRLSVDLGADLDPDQIFVTTTTTVLAGDPILVPDIGPVHQPGQEPLEFVPTTRSLTDFSLENVGVADLDFWTSASFTDASGNSIPSLNRSYVHGLVRDLNVGGSYESFLETHLLTSAQGQANRDAYASVMHAQMQVDAIEAKMAGDFADNKLLAPERCDRAFNWVTAVLDHPEDTPQRAKVDNHHIQANTLKINAVPIEGLIVIKPAETEAISALVIYTPEAPKGQRYKEFPSTTEMRDELLTDPQFLDYLVARAPADSQAELRRALTSDPGRLFITTDVITGNLYHASYEVEARRAISNVDQQTTSTGEANLRTAWEIASGTVGLALEFTPLRIRGAVAAGRSIYAFTKCVSAESSAATHCVQAALLLADGFTPGKSKAPKGVTPVLNTGLALGKSPTGLIRRTDGIYKGVFEKTSASGSSRFYIKSGSDTYLVRYDPYDPLQPTWKIVDRRRPDAYYQQRITQDKHGNWTPGKAGLPGGESVRPIDPDVLELADRASPLATLKPEQRIAYLTYLLDNRQPHEVKSLLKSLQTRGVTGMSRPWQQLHSSALEKAQVKIVVPLKRPHPDSQQPGPSGNARPASAASRNVLTRVEISEQVIPKEDWPKVLYHYTTQKNLGTYWSTPGHLFSSRPSSDPHVNARANMANTPGVYVTDLAPGSMSRADLADTLFGRNSYTGKSREDKVHSYMQLDMTAVRDARVQLVKVSGGSLSPHVYMVKPGTPDNHWRVTQGLMTGEGDPVLIAAGTTPKSKSPVTPS